MFCLCDLFRKQVFIYKDFRFERKAYKSILEFKKAHTDSLKQTFSLKLNTIYLMLLDSF